MNCRRCCLDVGAATRLALIEFRAMTARRGVPVEAVNDRQAALVRSLDLPNGSKGMTVAPEQERHGQWFRCPGIVTGDVRFPGSGDGGRRPLCKFANLPCVG